MSKIKVDKIVLKVGKKEKIELSLEEAKELQEVLADLLGVTTCTIATGYFEFPNESNIPYRKWKVNPWVPYEGSTTGTIVVSSGTSVIEGSAP